MTSELTIAPSLCNRYIADSYFHNSWFLVHYHKTFKSRKVVQGIPIKFFVSHRPPSCEGGSVGQRRSSKKKKNEHMNYEGASGCQWRPVNKTRSSAYKLKYLLLYKWFWNFFLLLQNIFCGNCLLTAKYLGPFPTVVLNRALVITLTIHMGCVPYLKVFKNDLYLKYINMCCLINKPWCLHAQLQKHNKSYWKVKTVIC